MSFLKSKYYDYPEGEDAFGKMMATNRYAITTGLIYSTYDVLMISKPQGYIRAIGRYAYFTGPLIGIASAFTMTTLAATKLRGKDDTLNYLAGAAASAGIIGAWRNNFVTGCCAALFLGIAAAVKKNSIEDGWEFFPEIKKHGQGTATSAAKYDFTLTADRPRNWTTGKQ